MLHHLWLFCKRLAVLLPGLIIAALAVRVALPYTPCPILLGFIIVIAYAVGAYVLVPMAVRFWHMVRPTSTLPLYSQTPDGFAADPINIGLIGSRRELRAAMEAIGWRQARSLTLRSVLKTIAAVIFHRSYPDMPVSNLFLFGRPQDIAFEKQMLHEGRGSRHHVRFWATTLEDVEEGTIAGARRPNRAAQQIGSSMLWAGAASRDVGITFAAGELKFTHAVSPNTNREREVLAKHLMTEATAHRVTAVRLHEPYSLSSFAWSRLFKTDGTMLVLRLAGKQPSGPVVPS